MHFSRTAATKGLVVSHALHGMFMPVHALAVSLSGDMRRCPTFSAKFFRKQLSPNVLSNQYIKVPHVILLEPLFVG
jgi:hypothetical protein